MLLFNEFEHHRRSISSVNQHYWNKYVENLSALFSSFMQMLLGTYGLFFIKTSYELLAIHIYFNAID